MHMAAEAGHVEVVKLLVESGASPRAESLVSFFSDTETGTSHIRCTCKQFRLLAARCFSKIN